MIDVQEIIAFVILFLAVLFLARKFFWNKKNKGCGTDDECSGCH
ncbi:FeoB-associated Cys-rich membrane protein [Flavobacterium sp. SM2513]